MKSFFNSPQPGSVDILVISCFSTNDWDGLSQFLMICGAKDVSGSDCIPCWRKSYVAVSTKTPLWSFSYQLWMVVSKFPLVGHLSVFECSRSAILCHYLNWLTNEQMKSHSGKWHGRNMMSWIQTGMNRSWMWDECAALNLVWWQMWPEVWQNVSHVLTSMPNKTGTRFATGVHQ